MVILPVFFLGDSMVKKLQAYNKAAETVYTLLQVARHRYPIPIQEGSTWY
jgi:hypothetical protein